ncbi:MAG: ribosome silencing factor [Saprospiraceae bacterium]|nr:ribosome silencing factor [Saprospiraceae bacterium]
MNLERQHVSRTISTIKLNELIVDSIKDIKGKGITKIDLTELEDAPADFFIVCEGDSSVQIKALSDHIQKRVKQEAALVPNHVEGERSARWILVDFFSTVVHIFFPETRGFYELEDLWSDAEITYYENP